MSWSACAAATSTFFGVQPRLGHVPPRSRASILATDSPARRTGPVTPMPALPPPMITTSNFSSLIGLSLGHDRGLQSFAGDAGGDRFDDHRGHVELGVAIPDVVASRNPSEIGPDRPDVAIVILRQQQTDGPVQPRI